MKISSIRVDRDEMTDEIIDFVFSFVESVHQFSSKEFSKNSTIRALLENIELQIENVEKRTDNKIVFKDTKIGKPYIWDN